METANKIAAVEEKNTRLYGPDADKRSKESLASMRAELGTIRAIGQAEEDAAIFRQRMSEQDRLSATEQARIEVRGNEMQAASEQRRLAASKLETAALYTITREERDALELELQRAKYAEESAVMQYAYQVRQSKLQTTVQELTLSGQTRAANQAKIQLQYDVDILKAKQHLMPLLAEQLEKQKALAKLSEDVREYELGGRGRAAERRAERRRAREIRVVQSRDRNREINAARNDAGGLDDNGGIHAGGGLITGGLSRPKSQRPKIEIEGIDQFKTQLMEKLDRVIGEVSQ
jgi:hypothetical protein